VQDLLLFYIFFESILIPMFVIIGIWGSRNRKIHAAYQFFLYTLTGSVAMLIAILYLLVSYGSVDIYLLETINYSLEEGRLLWLALFLSFAVKVPMVPVHIWLPEAHVEAPTGGSVILAGILLKMGTYGMLKFLLPVFTEASLFYQPLVYILSIIGILYASCTTIRQIDLKKIIAYSSVGHMNFVTLGIFGGTIYGLEGSIFLMISHGFVSSALFLCVGWLYERYGTRIIFYYGGLVFGMPIFSVFFLVLTLANISLPGTSSFVGEFLILLNCFYTNRVICFLASLGVLLGAIYAMWLYNRMIFGLVKIPLIKTYSDLNRREFFLLSILILLIIVTGLYPKIILEYLHPFVQLILNK
jgi:proton-translocating NADH-quinone oxidoreductase chain M